MDAHLVAHGRLIWGKDLANLLGIPDVRFPDNALFAIGHIENASGARAYARLSVAASFEDINLGVGRFHAVLIPPTKERSEPFLCKLHPGIQEPERIDLSGAIVNYTFDEVRFK